jgi:hypothetical protein
MVWAIKGHAIALNNASTSAIDTTGADLLIACYSSIGSAIPVPADSKSNTWIQAVTDSAGGRGGGWIFYCASPTVGTGHTFSATGGAAGVQQITALSGKIASPLDATNSAIFANNGTTTTRPTGSVTPTQSGEFCIALYEIDDPAGSTFTIDSGFTVLDSFDVVPGATFGLVVGYLAQGSAAAVNPTLTRSVAGTASNSEVAMVATFKGVAPAAESPLKRRVRNLYFR